MPLGSRNPLIAKSTQMDEELVLLQWLNSSFKLHERVVDLEKDLCDGFIFAQILHQSGLEPNLRKYESSSGWLDDDRRAHNIKLLWKRFRIIGHDIPMSLLQGMMSGDRSVIYRILRTMKTICGRRIKSIACGERGSGLSESQTPIRDIETPIRCTTTSSNGNKIHSNYSLTTKNFRLKHDMRSKEDRYRNDNKREKNPEKRKFKYADAKRQQRKRFENERNRKEVIDHLREFDEQVQSSPTDNDGQSTDAFESYDDHGLSKYHEAKPLNRMKLMKELRNQYQPRMIQQVTTHNIEHQSSGYPKTTQTKKSMRENTSIFSVSEKSLVSKREDTNKNVSIFTFRNEINMSACDVYLLSQRDQLDAHDKKMRVASVNRQAKMLEAYKDFVGSKKRSDRNVIQDLCSQFVGKIICLTLAIVSEAQENEMTEERYVTLRNEHMHLDSVKIETGKHISLDMGCEMIKEDILDAEHMFTSWHIRADDQLFGECSTKSNIPAYPPVEVLFSNVVTGWLESMDERTLQLAERTWPSLCGFKTVAMYTYEVGTISRFSTKKIAAQRKMHYLELDNVLEICADSSSMLEKSECTEPSEFYKRWLLPYQAKVTSYRQKNQEIPELLASEVMIAAIRACRENNDHLSGCVLENFPRSIVQLRQLEEAYLADFILDPATQAHSLASSDIFFDTLQKERTSTPLPPHDYILQSVDAVIRVLGDDSAFTPQSGMQTTSSDEILHVKATDVQGIIKDNRMCNSNGISMSVELFGVHNRLLQINISGMHEAVALEAMHVAIECFTSETFQPRATSEFCNHTYYPPMYMTARKKRRDKASVSDQLYWLNAEKQLQIGEKDIVSFSAEFKQINKKYNDEIVLLLSTIFTGIRMIAEKCQKFEQDIRNILNVQQTLQQKLDQALSRPEKREEINISLHDMYNILEVELGDIVDNSRVKANLWSEKFVLPSFTEDSHLANIREVFLSLVRPLCEKLVERTMKRIHTIETNMYARLPFLRSEKENIAAPRVLENTPLISVIHEIMNLSKGKQDSNMFKLLHSLNDSISTLYHQNEFTDKTIIPDSAEEQECNRSNMISEDNAAWTSVEYTQPTEQTSYDSALNSSEDIDTLLCRTAVWQSEIGNLLYQIYALCHMISSIVQIVDEVFVGEILEFDELIIINTKRQFQDIAGMMKDLSLEYEHSTKQATRHFNWPLSRVEVTRSFSLLSLHLPSICSSNFLSLSQVKLLIQEFRSFGRDDIDVTSFAKIVHECSSMYDFPEKWQESLSVVSLAHSFISGNNLIYWRSFILSILRVQFTNFPSLQVSEDYCKKLIAHFCSQNNRPTFMAFIRSSLSFEDFVKLPIWFDTSERFDKEFEIGKEITSVIFKLIETPMIGMNEPRNPSCTMQSIFWHINATISNPSIRHSHLFAHGNTRHVQNLNRVLPNYCLGIFRGAAIVSTLIQTDTLVDTGSLTQYLPHDEPITRECAADALRVLLEVSNHSALGFDFDYVNECATKLKKFYIQNQDVSYVTIAGEDTVQNSHIASRLSLQDPFRSLAAVSQD